MANEMHNDADKDDFDRVISELISKKKFGEALNYLQRILDTDGKNEKALAFKNQVQKILEYQNRDIFGSINLNMDPWLE